MLIVLCNITKIYDMLILAVVVVQSTVPHDVLLYF